METSNETKLVFPAQDRDPVTGQYLPGNIANGSKIPTLLRKPLAEVQATIDEYIEECKDKDISATIPGLAYALGFNSRQALSHALNKTSLREGEAYVQQAVLASVKRAKLFIESQRTQRMVDGKGSTVGAIFDLKVNHGYEEVTRVQNDNRLHITWGSEEKPIDITPETAQIED